MIYVDFEWCGLRFEAEVVPRERATWDHPGFPPYVDHYIATVVDEDEVRSCWDLDEETVPDLARWAADRDEFEDRILEEASEAE